MTPRVQVTWIEADQTAEQIVTLSHATGYSRFPVTGENTDDILGVVHVKQAFAVALSDRSTVTARDLMVEPTRVPESMEVETLLVLLRRSGFQIAIVTDEYGGTAGIATLEDLVEEIVGELEDEHDRHKAGIIRAGKTITFDAGWRPDELLERTGISVPDDAEYETIAGFVTDELDRIPEVGDEAELPTGTLRVERVDGARVLRLSFTPTESAHDDVVDALKKELK